MITNITALEDISLINGLSKMRLL